MPHPPHLTSATRLMSTEMVLTLECSSTRTVVSVVSFTIPTEPQGRDRDTLHTMQWIDLMWYHISHMCKSTHAEMLNEHVYVQMLVCSLTEGELH